MGIEPASSGLLDQCSTTELQKTSRGRGFDSQPEGLGVAFFATGPGLGLIMYILTTLEFPTHNFDFHILD